MTEALALRVALALPHAGLTVGDELPPGSQPWSALLAGPALDRVVGDVRERLRGCEPRVAASTLHLGLLARIWAVTLGSVVLGGRQLDLADLTWADDRGSVALHLRRPTSSEPDLSAVWRDWAQPLEERMHAEYGLARGLLRGNVTSGLMGTARILAGARARQLAEELAASEPLAGTFEEGRRRSCCLFYRVPGGGVCGDCCFVTAPAARRP